MKKTGVLVGASVFGVAAAVASEVSLFVLEGYSLESLALPAVITAIFSGGWAGHKIRTSSNAIEAAVIGMIPPAVSTVVVAFVFSAAPLIHEPTLEHFLLMPIGAIGLAVFAGVLTGWITLPMGMVAGAVTYGVLTAWGNRLDSLFVNIQLRRRDETLQSRRCGVLGALLLGGVGGFTAWSLMALPGMSPSPTVTSLFAIVPCLLLGYYVRSEAPHLALRKLLLFGVGIWLFAVLAFLLQFLQWAESGFYRGSQIRFANIKWGCFDNFFEDPLWTAGLIFPGVIIASATLYLLTHFKITKSRSE